MKFCILISAFCLQTSVGLSLDVSVDTILSPSGTIDSGQSTLPRMVISGGPAPDVSAWFAIDDGTPSGYVDSITHFEMAMRTETLSFSGWVPRGRDTMTAIAWVRCPDDTNPANDTFRQWFLVRITDIGLSDLWPSGDTVFDSGDVIVPHVTAWNLGNITTSFVLWGDSVTLPPGGDTVVYEDTIIGTPGIWVVEAFAVVVGDLHPENNLVLDTFTVRGTITVDVDARAVLAPTGVVETTQTITPNGRFGNNGVDAADFWAFFRIRNPSGSEIYAESSRVLLSAGDSTDLDYPAIKFSVLGSYTAVCSVDMHDNDTTNNVKRVSFFVVEHEIPPDIGIVFIVMPCDTVDTITVFDPTITAKNYSPFRCSTYLFLLFADTSLDRTVYAESACLRLQPGDTAVVVFPAVRFTVSGEHEGRCWAVIGDTIGWSFWVVPQVDVEESPTPQVSGYKLWPTILSGASGVKRLASCVVFDAAGRRVVNPKPGVYFVMSEPSAVSRQPSAVTVRKVVLQR